MEDLEENSDRLEEFIMGVNSDQPHQWMYTGWVRYEGVESKLFYGTFLRVLKFVIYQNYSLPLSKSSLVDTWAYLIREHGNEPTLEQVENSLTMIDQNSGPEVIGEADPLFIWKTRLFGQSVETIVDSLRNLVDDQLFFMIFNEPLRFTDHDLSNWVQLQVPESINVDF